MEEYTTTSNRINHLYLYCILHNLINIYANDINHKLYVYI